MRRLMVVLAAMLVALALACGAALAEPGSETSRAAPSGDQGSVLAREAERPQTPQPQGQPEFRVDYDPEGNPYMAGELLVTYEERISARSADAVNAEAGANVETELPEIDAASLSFPDVKGWQDREAREGRQHGELDAQDRQQRQRHGPRPAGGARQGAHDG